MFYILEAIFAIAGIALVTFWVGSNFSALPDFVFFLGLAFLLFAFATFIKTMRDEYRRNLDLEKRFRWMIAQTGIEYDEAKFNKAMNMTIDADAAILTALYEEYRELLKEK